MVRRTERCANIQLVTLAALFRYEQLTNGSMTDEPRATLTGFFREC